MLTASEIQYSVGKNGDILSPQEERDTQINVVSFDFYTVQPSDFATIDARDYWRRDFNLLLPKLQSGLLLPSLWLPDLGRYIAQFRDLIDRNESTLICPAIFGQVRKRQVSTDRYSISGQQLEQEIQRQVNLRLEEIIAEDFPRIMQYLYVPGAAEIFTCSLVDSKEIMLEVPTIPAKLPWWQRILLPEPHKRGRPENFRVGRVKIQARNPNMLLGR